MCVRSHDLIKFNFKTKCIYNCLSTSHWKYDLKYTLCRNYFKKNQIMTFIWTISLKKDMKLEILPLHPLHLPTCKRVHPTCTTPPPAPPHLLKSSPDLHHCTPCTSPPFKEFTRPAPFCSISNLKTTVGRILLYCKYRIKRFSEH